MNSSHSTSNKRIAKNTLFLYIRMAIVLVVSLYTTREVLHALGAEDYGIYNVVAGFVALFASLNTSLSSAANRFYNHAIGEGKENGVSKVYSSTLIIQLVFALIIFLLVEAVGIWYVNSKMVIPADRLFVAKILFQYSVVSLVLLIIQIPYSAAVLAYERMDFYAVVSILDALLKLGIVFLIKRSSLDKLLFYGTLMLVIHIINFLMYAIYAKVSFKELHIIRPIEKKITRSMLSFSGWSLLEPVAYSLRGQGTNMVFNYYFGPLVNAANGIASQISSAIHQFTGNFSIAFRPQIIQSYASGEYERSKRLVFSMSKINYFLQLMLIVPLSVEINYILHLWLGDTVPEYAASFAVFILIVRTINTLNSPLSNLVSATGNIKRYKTASAILVCSIVPLSIILLQMGLNPNSAYIGMVVITVINQFVCIKNTCRVFPYLSGKEYCTKILFPCIRHTFLVVIIPLLLPLLMSTSFLRLVLSCSASLAITCLSAYYWNLDDNEKKIFKNMFTSFKQRLLKKNR